MEEAFKVGKVEAEAAALRGHLHLRGIKGERESSVIIMVALMKMGIEVEKMEAAAVVSLHPTPTVHNRRFKRVSALILDVLGING